MAVSQTPNRAALLPVREPAPAFLAPGATIGPDDRVPALTGLVALARGAATDQEDPVPAAATDREDPVPAAVIGPAALEPEVVTAPAGQELVTAIDPAGQELVTAIDPAGQELVTAIDLDGQVPAMATGRDDPAPGMATAPDDRVMETGRGAPIVQGSIIRTAPTGLAESTGPIAPGTVPIVPIVIVPTGAIISRSATTTT